MGDNDVHAGARRAAMRILDQAGLFRGPGAASRKRVAQIVDERVRLSGSHEPFIPSPFRIGELLAGANVAMAAMCIMLEGARAKPREATADLNVEHAAMVGYAPFLTEWDAGNEGKGHWTEICEIMNNRLTAEMAAKNGSTVNATSAASTSQGSEELRDPPPGTPSVSPLFTTLRFFLSDVWRCADNRHVFFFPRLTDDPKKVLGALNFTPEQINRLIQLSITTPATHPKTYIAHRTEFLNTVKSHLLKQDAFAIEAQFAQIKAIAVVPRTRAEFDKTEQGIALSKVPRVCVERTGEIRAPWTEDEWSEVIAGRKTEEVGSLWKETGWNYGSISGSDASRGVLYGVKVLEITRIVAGPQIGLQLSSLGSDSMRLASPEIIDYPAHDLLLNLNKRCVMMDLKNKSHRQRFIELLLEADVIINNLLNGSLEKLGFGFQDVLKMVERRGKGIVYAETNTFGFYGPNRFLPGVENLGQHMSGISMAQGGYQPFTTPQATAFPCVTPILFCDITTGLHTATGILVSLYKRAMVGGSYLVRSSLTQTALSVQDLGMYGDREMVVEMFEGYPKHESELSPDPSKVAHNGELEYLYR